MIKKLFNQPHILYQTPDADCDIEEPAIAFHKDNSGIIVMEQKENEIIINRNSIPEVIKLLRSLTK